ncbi:MAG: hypothetical protein H6667_25745 [Ardenticatenaceae bacterium]|nr:hypothetical protein [Ardenticatenaceae bacterium]
MSEARKQVLQMLQDGKLTAEQAQELLQALEPTTEEPQEAIEGEVVQPVEPPDMERFRRFWQYPFFIALAVLVAVGLGLRSLYQASEGMMTFWLFCVSGIFALTFILTVLAFMSRSAPWVHVRVKEKTGRKIAISLPLPMGLAQWGIGIARNFVPETEQGNLDMAAEFIRSARHDLKGPGTEPLMINVDDEDGDQVQVFIG